jgi:hypothetical protein
MVGFLCVNAHSCKRSLPHCGYCLFVGNNTVATADMATLTFTPPPDRQAAMDAKAQQDRRGAVGVSACTGWQVLLHALWLVVGVV